MWQMMICQSVCVKCLLFNNNIEQHIIKQMVYRGAQIYLQNIVKKDQAEENKNQF